MQDDLMSALRHHRAGIRARWEDLLRVERANTPLANPDALVHLIDWTLDEVYRTLEGLPSRRRPLRPYSKHDIECPCGRNPLLAYFAAGEQALQESLVVTQSELPHLEPADRDASLAELNLCLRFIARREIQAFCALCQLRQSPMQSVPDAAHAT
jgi:hypothetical protein